MQLLKTEYDTTRILYNRFVSAISQKPTIATVLSPDVSTDNGGVPGGGGRACLTCTLGQRDAALPHAPSLCVSPARFEYTSIHT